MSETSAVRVYVPADTDSVSYVQGYFAERFGGCTTYQAKGDWINDTGEVFKDDMAVVESVTDSNQPVTVAKRVSRIVKERTGEDSVMWEIRPITVVGYE